jgi:cell division protein ZapB
LNHAAGTNGQDFRAFDRAVSQKLRGPLFAGKLQSPTMPASSPIDQIAERVDRLLVRHEEVQRTNALLQEQVEALTRERDALKSRLAAARTRLDALLERLPAEPPSEDSPA